MKPPKLPIKDFDDELEEFENDDEKARSIPKIEDTVDAHGRLLNQKPAYDRLIHNEVQLQLGENVQTAKVIQRSLGPDEVIVGMYDENPALNSILYDVEFPDGTIREYAANVIAENMLTQVDEDGSSLSLMEGIVNYKRDPATAFSKYNKYVVTRRGQKRLRKTTVGWKLLIRWMDGS